MCTFLTVIFMFIKNFLTYGLKKVNIDIAYYGSKVTYTDKKMKLKWLAGNGKALLNQLKTFFHATFMQ